MTPRIRKIQQRRSRLRQQKLRDDMPAAVKRLERQIDEQLWREVNKHRQHSGIVIGGKTAAMTSSSEVTIDHLLSLWNEVLR